MKRKDAQPNPVSTALALIKSDSRNATEALASEGHNPLHELILVAQGKSRRAHPTVLKVISLLEKIATANPAIAPMVLLVKAEVESELLGCTSQREINRINLALLQYQHAAMKPVEQPQPENIGEGTFAEAVARHGAKLN